MTETLRPDPIHRPAHYAAGRFGCECITIARLMPFNVGNAFKYVWRHEDKEQRYPDIAKAIKYLTWAIQNRDKVWITPEAEIQGRNLFDQHVRGRLDELPDTYWALETIVDGAFCTARRILAARILEPAA